MSSYIVNSKYVDPKFPPCEEYSQTSYIPDQGTEFYSPSQDTDFQHPGIYSRSNYTEQTFSCNTVQGSTVQPPGVMCRSKPANLALSPLKPSHAHRSKCPARGHADSNKTQKAKTGYKPNSQP
ncbi:hypothetical protein SKAU_G00235010 [Synaphobranchus kaupii]|uniref:Homeobox protein D4 n=1 Tax=Synaphobranchus kaupii TaxID=118154 RepID=A0A9Q1F6I7_SYNKA|nr:hypothetical protein SKAU_G00235010 [Synaphobranchus kaupii]